MANRGIKALTRKQIAQAKRMMKQQRLTQREVATAFGVSQTTISFAVNRQGAYA